MLINNGCRVEHNLVTLINTGVTGMLISLYSLLRDRVINYCIIIPV